MRVITFSSEKLEKAGTVDFKKHPARKVGTRSRQCGPKVPGRFAFPGARNPRICSIWRFGKIFPAIFPEFSRNFPPELPQRPQKQPQPAKRLSCKQEASNCKQKNCIQICSELRFCYEKDPNFPKIWSLYFVYEKKPRDSRQISRIISQRKVKKKKQRLASAGAQLRRS